MTLAWIYVVRTELGPVVAKERVALLEDAIERLDRVPGINRLTAEVLIAEIGTDMSRFPTAGHLAYWAGMAPDKRLSGKTRKGSKWLRSTLVKAALTAERKNNGHLAAQYRRLARRLGKKKAAMAVILEPANAPPTP
jgi:transposase